MPLQPQNNLDETFVRMQMVSRTQAGEIDFCFFRDIDTKSECPEHNEHCTRVKRDQAHTIYPKTIIFYMLVLHLTQAKPTTTETSITQKKLSKKLSVHNGEGL